MANYIQFATVVSVPIIQLKTMELNSLKFLTQLPLNPPNKKVSQKCRNFCFKKYKENLHWLIILKYIAPFTSAKTRLEDGLYLFRATTN